VGKLVLLLADGTTLDVPLAKERMTIGRRADNDICLPHPAVSGEHASVVTILADSFLEDLGSTNGTLVNGKPIVKHFLRDYDQIDIGRQRLVFVSDDNAHVDPLPPDIARNQLLGLNARVEPARPVVASAAPLRGAAAKALPLRYPDLDEEVALHEAIPEVAARKDAAPNRTPIADRHPAPNRHESDQRLAAWAAEWAAPAGKAGAGPIDTSGAPAGASRAGAASRTAAPIAPVVPEVPTPPVPTVRVLSGPNHGRAVPFNKEELSLGRVGLQVAVVRKVGTGFRLVPVEGVQPPRINGMPVAPEGTALHPGDTFEVAGVRLELSITS
jgi:pSer/pThr/pTyr-binding forkhead associated (FHA) protein